MPSYCDSQSSLLPLSEAIARMVAAISPLTDQEEVTLADALDRILAEDQLAISAMPPFATAAMDGYALRASEAADPLTVVGRVLAGGCFQGELGPRQALRIMTGAPVPPAVDTVVMQEVATVSGDQLQVPYPQQAGSNVRLAGSEVAEGELLIAAGSRLSPRHIALLASQGLDRVRVIRRPRVAVMSTGDELVSPGQPLQPGQIYDSNRPAVISLLHRLNVEVVDLGRIGDQPEALRDTLQRAASSADALISSGGVSVGEADFIRPLLAELGEIGFWKLAIKPGKPFAFGRIGQAWFFGLPGNPVSAMVTFDQLAQRGLRHLAGERPQPPVLLSARAAAPFRKQPGRLDLQRVVIRTAADGQLEALPAGGQGSAQLTSLTSADGLAHLQREQGPVAPGEMILVEPFSRGWQ